jgi:hypothetical protein
MKLVFKIFNLFICTTAFVLAAHADKGKKTNKAKINLSIGTKGTLRSNLLGNTYSLKNNLKTTTLSYGFNKKSVVTFQRGNTIYVLPYKPKVIVNETKRNYSGVKIIIGLH